MCFQRWAWFREPRLYIISNGWREFSYEHSLKVTDRLVFTLVSSSHFVVEFANLNGSTRAMFPTRDVKNYPWSVKYTRLDCLASANRKVQLQAVKEKQIRKKAQVVKEKQIRKKFPTVKEKQIRKKAQVVKEKQIRKKTQAVKEKQIRQKVASIILPNEQKLQKEKFCQCNTVGIGRNLTANSRKEYVFPEFTHMECKNPDGSPYLQILDSDSEISVVDED